MLYTEDNSNDYVRKNEIYADGVSRALRKMHLLRYEEAEQILLEVQQAIVDVETDAFQDDPNLMEGYWAMKMEHEEAYLEDLPRAPLDDTAQIVIDYLTSLGINLSKTKGPHYLIECYQLYIHDQIEPSPHALALIAYWHGTRQYHVRKALARLCFEIMEKDPDTARWTKKHDYFYIAALFEYMEERAAAKHPGAHLSGQPGAETEKQGRRTPTA